MKENTGLHFSLLYVQKVHRVYIVDLAVDQCVGVLSLSRLSYHHAETGITIPRRV